MWRRHKLSWICDGAALALRLARALHWYAATMVRELAAAGCAAMAWGVVAVAMMVISVQVRGAQQPNCEAAYSSLADCLTYVSGPATTPSVECCLGIAVVNADSPDCLCQMVNQFNSGSNPQVNVTKALHLPLECGVAVDTVKCPALSTSPPGLRTPPSGGAGGLGSALGSSAGESRPSGMMVLLGVAILTGAVPGLLRNLFV